MHNKKSQEAKRRFTFIAKAKSIRSQFTELPRFLEDTEQLRRSHGTLESTMFFGSFVPGGRIKKYNNLYFHRLDF
jgi:hypothetical protein